MQHDSISHGAVKTEEEHRRDICTAGRWIHERGYVASTDGNISVRLGPDRILISATAMCKSMMEPGDLIVIDREGRRVSGMRQPSSELAMHLLIYRLRPDVNAVCHAHPPTATGYAAAGLPLDKPILCELVIGLGRIPVAPYGTPGTAELTAEIEPFVQGHDAILMANHGVVTYGPDLLTAFLHMETTEHFARVSLVTELLGKQVLLSGRDVEKLEAARARYGADTQPAAPAAPIDSVHSDGGPTGRVTLTRRELETLIDEAVRRDRTLR
ncbi:MAG TPA: class II aldolase/adducin family protein [Candidatus Acidoferrales bacterium]|nr:class II aldolase/adducin family protein [Candidatus Acidoferrales bacterium]